MLGKDAENMTSIAQAISYYTHPAPDSKEVWPSLW